MQGKAEKLTANHTAPLFPEIYTEQSINKENSSLFIIAFFRKTKTKARNLKSDKSQDYSQKPQ
jgi:hypothetical protein